MNWPAWNIDTQTAAGFAAVVLLLFWLVRRGRGSKRAYRRAGALFTPAEQRFLATLEKAVDGRARIYGKVRLADVLAVRDTVSGKHWYRAFNRIACKHVDYLLCDLNSFQTILVIELDDRSHERAERRERDDFLDRALIGAGIPILHVTVQARYTIREVQEILREFLPPR